MAKYNGTSGPALLLISIEGGAPMAGLCIAPAAAAPTTTGPQEYMLKAIDSPKGSEQKLDFFSCGVQFLKIDFSGDFGEKIK